MATIYIRRAKKKKYEQIKFVKLLSSVCVCVYVSVKCISYLGPGQKSNPGSRTKLWTVVGLHFYLLFFYSMYLNF